MPETAQHAGRHCGGSFPIGAGVGRSGAWLTARHDAPQSSSAQGLGLDALLPAGLGALLPNLRELTVFPCSLTPAARTTALLDAASFARLEKLTLYSLKVEDQDDNPGQQVRGVVLVMSW